MTTAAAKALMDGTIFMASPVNVLYEASGAAGPARGRSVVRESVGGDLYTVPVARDAVHQLLATDVGLDKLGARGISAIEVEQLPRNRYATIRNPREAGERGKRRLLIGRTDGGRVLTLVIEGTVDPTTWLVVTDWESTAPERRILETR